MWHCEIHLLYVSCIYSDYLKVSWQATVVSKLNSNMFGQAVTIARHTGFLSIRQLASFITILVFS